MKFLPTVDPFKLLGHLRECSQLVLDLRVPEFEVNLQLTELLLRHAVDGNGEPL